MPSRLLQGRGSVAVTTTATKRKRKPQQKRGSPAPTLGPYVCAWIERNLVHGEGDYYGRPFRLLKFQKRFIWNAYELQPDGDRRYRRVLWGLPSGNGKTEIAAALACAELAGPVICKGFRANGAPIAGLRVSPDIPVAAASFEQADLLFGAARVMLAEGPLAEYVEAWDTEILLKDRPGRIYRVAAKAGTNDGKRPTFFVADELHEWNCTCTHPGGVHVGACKARVYTVLSKGRAKRRGAWELVISTAGWNSTSLLGDMYREGMSLLETGQGDERYLFDWVQSVEKTDERGEPIKVDLTDRKELTTAIREANPGIDEFLSMENLLSDAGHMPEFEFRRYHLNQWTEAPDHWLKTGTWDECVGETAPPADGVEVVLGLDGSYDGDSTAVVGATVEDIPHIFVVGAWEKPPDDKEWRVDILDVEAAIATACGKWRVKWVGCDPYRWQRSMAVMNEAGFPVLEWPSHLPSRMVPACATFFDMVIDKKLTHDGDPRLAKHLDHCIIKIDSRGPRITKDHKDSVRRIDLAVCAVIVMDLVVRARNAGSWKVIE